MCEKTIKKYIFKVEKIYFYYLKIYFKLKIEYC